MPTFMTNNRDNSAFEQMEQNGFVNVWSLFVKFDKEQRIIDASTLCAIPDKTSLLGILKVMVNQLETGIGDN